MIANRITLNADPCHPYTPAYVGLYENVFTIGTKQRRMLTYIPEDTKSSTSGIYLFPPNGVTAEQFLTESNWIDIADGEEHREKLVLFVLEAADGGCWDTEEAYEAAGGEHEYVWQAFQTGMGRELCCVYEGKRYIVGYREGGTVAQKFAMWNPADIGGIATVDAPPVQQSYIDAAAQSLCPRLHNYVDEACSRSIKKSDIPMRAWFIDSKDVSDRPEVLHWRHANCDEPDARPIEMDTKEYYRTKPLAHPLDGEIEGYSVWVTQTDKASEQLGRRWNRSIWKKFLYQYTRWAGNPGGSYRKALDPVCDLGMEYHYETVDDWKREWYVHVPKSVATHPDTPVPLVFVPHGYTCTGELCVRNADWYRVADEYGFVAVFPTALLGTIQGSSPEVGVLPTNCPLPAWNVYDDPDKPDEFRFFQHMLNDVCAHHAIDRTRVFASGTSMGNLMVQYLALKKPQWLTAIAPTSGIIHMIGGEIMLNLDDVKHRDRIDIPVWMFGGEMEAWLLDWIPAPGNRTGKTLYAWWELNQMHGDPPTDFTDSKTVMERWHDWTYEKDGIPMLKFTGIDYYPHGSNPEMSYRIWTEFFSKLSRSADGTLHWEG